MSQTDQIRFDDGAAYERYMGTWSRLAGGALLEWLAPAAGLRWLDVGGGTGAGAYMPPLRLSAPRSGGHRVWYWVELARARRPGRARRLDFAEETEGDVCFLRQAALCEVCKAALFGDPCPDSAGVFVRAVWHAELRSVVALRTVPPASRRAAAIGPHLPR